ncbi:MAG: hypothetical protein GY950_09595 [bacterium]|nr:hypothetical protein [bacterium]
MEMSTINHSINTVGLDKLAEAYPNKPIGAASSALKGSLETQEMVQGNIAEMMKEISPHLGQNIDVEA